jgi:hypothetical protein
VALAADNFKSAIAQGRITDADVVDDLADMASKFDEELRIRRGAKRNG